MLTAILTVLDQHTLASVALKPKDFRAVFQTPGGRQRLAELPADGRHLDVQLVTGAATREGVPSISGGITARPDPDDVLMVLIHLHR